MLLLLLLLLLLLPHLQVREHEHDGGGEAEDVEHPGGPEEDVEGRRDGAGVGHVDHGHLQEVGWNARPGGGGGGGGNAQKNAQKTRILVEDFMRPEMPPVLAFFNLGLKFSLSCLATLGLPLYYTLWARPCHVPDAYLPVVGDGREPLSDPVVGPGDQGLAVMALVVLVLVDGALGNRGC